MLLLLLPTSEITHAIQDKATTSFKPCQECSYSSRSDHFGDGWWWRRHSGLQQWPFFSYLGILCVVKTFMLKRFFCPDTFIYTFNFRFVSLGRFFCLFLQIYSFFEIFVAIVFVSIRFCCCCCRKEGRCKPGLNYVGNAT